MQAHTPLPWLDVGAAFPPVGKAWATGSPAPGLLAAGGALDVPTLEAAYCAGIFPWYSQGQPILWWSPDPRMVLRVEEFKLHRSLRKTLHKFAMSPDCELRIDHDFTAVIHACAHTRRDAEVLHARDATADPSDTPPPSTWIVPDMQAAYIALQAAGLAHSIETWVGGKLVGGLYCTAIGGAVFGESMFSTQSDASKIALCALVALCRAQGVGIIDCQQNTTHLASLGAREMPRDAFCAAVKSNAQQAPRTWRFDPIYWNQLYTPHE
jgi:leucyl/phenylalanyl-tRNA---protein transferase